MNLKMVSIATNLWVRLFQPPGIIVSVSGSMGISREGLSEPDELKEFIKRLLKEGARLRFNLPQDDISSIQIFCPNLDNAL